MSFYMASINFLDYSKIRENIVYFSSHHGEGDRGLLPGLWPGLFGHVSGWITQPFLVSLIASFKSSIPKVSPFLSISQILLAHILEFRVNAPVRYRRSWQK